MQTRVSVIFWLKKASPPDKKPAARGAGKEAL